MTEFNLITLDVKEVSMESIRLTLDLGNLLIPENKRSFELMIENPVSNVLTENMIWIFENDDRNTVHDNAIKGQIRDVGIALFDAVFRSLEFTSSKVKIEDCFLRIDCRQAFPWEILYDNNNSQYVLHAARGFSRSAKLIFHPSKIKQIQAPIRVLLVITRPFKFKDVHFRTISNLLFDLLSNEDNYEVTVLRPGTYKALEETLTNANNNNNPFTIVHFDGHGVHGSEKIGLNPQKGYVVFEDESGKDGVFIGGNEMGELLLKQGVNVLVLNACRSGYKQQVYKETNAVSEELELEFGSFAEDVIRSGINAVVAMRYKVEVEKAFSFIMGFYHQLAQGQWISASFKAGTYALSAHGEENVLLPILYENDPVVFKKKRKGLLGLFKKTSKNIVLKDRVRGFDDWITRIDKEFQYSSLVILLGMEGSGKSSLAKEFSHWALDSNLTDAVILEPKESLDPLIATLNKNKESRYFITVKAPRSEDELMAFKAKVAEINVNTKILYLAGYVDPQSELGFFPHINLNGVELELDGLDKNLVDEVHDQTLELIFENFEGNPLTLKTLLKGIQKSKANVFVSDLWTHIDNTTLIENLKLENFEKQFSINEQQVLALMSIVGNQFDIEMFNSIVQIAATHIPTVADGLLAKAQQNGFIGWNGPTATPNYKLHPLMKVYLFRQWNVFFDGETQQQLLRQISQYLQENMQSANPFSRLKFEKAAAPFISCCIINKSGVDLAFWLTLLNKKYPVRSVAWKNLLDLGLKAYKPTHEVNFPSSVRDKNFAVFAYYKKEFDISMFDFVDTTEVVFFIKMLLEKRIILNLENEVSVSAFIWMSKLVAYGAEAAINNIKVQPYSRVVYLEVIEQLSYLEKMLRTLNNPSAQDVLSKILYVRAEYQSFKINNYIFWMKNMATKNKGFKACDITDERVFFYLENVNESVDYKIFGQNLKHMEDAIAQTLSILANSQNLKEIPMNAAQLNNLEAIVLGYQFKDEFEKAAADFQESIQLTTDKVSKDFIALAYNRMIRNVRGKLLYCLLSEEEIINIGQSGLIAELSKMERVVNFKEKELTGKALDLWQYVNKSYPILVESDLEIEEGKMKELAYKGEFDQAILIFEKLRKEYKLKTNVIAATVFESEFLVELMVNTSINAQINQFETPIPVYIRDSIDEIKKRLLLLEYENTIRQPNSIFKSMEDWMDELLDEMKKNNSSDVGYKYVGEIGQHIYSRLDWIDSHNLMEQEGILEANQFLLATLNKYIAYQETDDSELYTSKLDLKSAWIELGKFQEIRSKREQLIRFTIDEEKLELLEFGEFFYLMQLGSYQMPFEQRIKWTKLAQERLERDKLKLDEKEENGLAEFIHLYQESLGYLAYEQGRAGGRIIAASAEKALQALEASKLLKYGLKNHCETVYSDYLKQLFKEGLTAKDAQDSIHHWSFYALLQLTHIEDYRPLVKAKWVKIARELFDNLLEFRKTPEQQNNSDFKATMYELERHWDVIELILISKSDNYSSTLTPNVLENILNRLENELGPEGNSRISRRSSFKSKLLRGGSIREKTWNLTKDMKAYQEDRMKQRAEIGEKLKEQFKSDIQINIYE